MGKGGSTEVKETSREQAAAEVANKQWNIYLNELRPFENIFMDKVDSLNNESRYQDIAGDTNLEYQQQFGKARQQAAQGLAAAGVDPSSGKFRGAMDNLTADQVAGQIDTTTRAQTTQQDRYVAGQQDVQAMGSGQQADALAGYSNLARTAAQKAQSDAQQSLANQNATGNLIGTGLGLATSMGLGSFSGGKKDEKTTPYSLQGADNTGGLGLSTSWRSYA